ncbi:unnamed protein product [Prorocentrum cordatum]|uniref:Cysteine dioxygenase n=1 Tax=Prorocentrum cordatum TaxID=2364126 RepID=A0ABN9S5V1_9DINO|nr:unnamed protein product [Polarella glacialis]
MAPPRPFVHRPAAPGGGGLLQEPSAGPAVWVGPGEVPGLLRLAEWHLEAGAVSAPLPPEAARASSVCWGLAGAGRVRLLPRGGAASELPLGPGCSAAVPPGLPYELVGPCRCWEVWLCPPEASENDASCAPCAAPGTSPPLAPPRALAADDAMLAPQPTAHSAAAAAAGSGASSKRVHLKYGQLPRVFQLSTAQLGPGQPVERHLHPDASELYIGLLGRHHLCCEAPPAAGGGGGDAAASAGAAECQSEARAAGAEEPAAVEHDLEMSPGSVALVNPGTYHRVWLDEPSELVMMLFSAGP